MPAPPGDTHRDTVRVIEISSLLNTLYINSHTEDSDEVSEPTVNPVGNEIVGLDSEISNLSLTVKGLQMEIYSFKDAFCSVSERSVNREMVFRKAVNQQSEKIKIF